MPTRADVAKLIETYLSSNWNQTQIQFENIEAKDPTDPTKLLSEGVLPYLFSAIQFADSDTMEVGREFRRTYGVIYFEVRVKDGTGTRLAQTYLSSLQGLFEYKDLAEVKIRKSGSNNGFSSGGWYILPITFKFRYDRQEQM